VLHTVDAKRPRAEAVAVRSNRIVAVGSNADVRPFFSSRTRVLELGDRTVVPGFDDSHAHFLDIGFARLDVDLVGTRSYAELVERVAAAVQGRRPGEWVRGPCWQEGKWDGTSASRAVQLAPRRHRAETAARRERSSRWQG
jgi:predicted amidohydrolase YtcJ